MGVAGSGKSVQGKLLAQDLGLRWLSTGEMLRQKVTGERQKEMLEGKLLGDEEIIKLIDEYIQEQKDENSSFVLDGFPRTLAQAKWLIDEYNDKKINIDGVVHINASRQVVKDRLLKRGRPDDNEKAISVRFEEYENFTLPIIDCFKRENISVFEVDGERKIAEVHQEIVNFFRG
jgi:adenylate kinase